MTAPPLAVRRFDHGRYMVRSEHPAQADTWHLCQLPDAEYPHGCCSCLDNSIRIQAPLNRAEQPERLDCKHLRQVRAELERARELCEAAGLPFSANIIPVFA